MTNETAKSLAQRERLIEGSQGLVRAIALKIHRKLPRGFDLDDLIGFGQVGLVEAVEDFRPETGVQFSTFAWYRIRGSILDGVARMSWFGNRGRSQVSFDAAANDILRSQETDGSGIAAGFGTAVRAMGAAFLLSLQVETTSEPVGRSEQPEESLEQAELKSLISEAINRLPESEQDLVRGVYFEGLSIADAGRRLKVGRAWSSRVHARALEQLGRILSDTAANH